MPPVYDQPSRKTSTWFLIWTRFVIIYAYNLDRKCRYIERSSAQFFPVFGLSTVVDGPIDSPPFFRSNFLEIAHQICLTFFNEVWLLDENSFHSKYFFGQNFARFTNWKKMPKTYFFLENGTLEFLNCLYEVYFVEFKINHGFDFIGKIKKLLIWAKIYANLV